MQGPLARRVAGTAGAKNDIISLQALAVDEMPVNINHEQMRIEFLHGISGWHVGPVRKFGSGNKGHQWSVPLREGVNTRIVILCPIFIACGMSNQCWSSNAAMI